MDRFENMNTFIRVVELVVSGAADRLTVAKSAVSRRLKELEEHLGIELFHRTTRRMNLTDTGRAFYHPLLDSCTWVLPLLNNYKSIHLDAYAIYPQTRHLSQRVREFVDFLVKRFEGVAYWDICI